MTIYSEPLPKDAHKRVRDVAKYYPFGARAFISGKYREQQAAMAADHAQQRKIAHEERMRLKQARDSDLPPPGKARDAWIKARIAARRHNINPPESPVSITIVPYPTPTPTPAPASPRSLSYAAC